MSTAAAADGGQAKKPRTIRRVPITLLSGFLGGKRPPTPQVARRRASCKIPFLLSWQVHAPEARPREQGGPEDRVHRKRRCGRQH